MWDKLQQLISIKFSVETLKALYEEFIGYS